MAKRNLLQKILAYFKGNQFLTNTNANLTKLISNLIYKRLMIVFVLWIFRGYYLYNILQLKLFLPGHEYIIVYYHITLTILYLKFNVPIDLIIIKLESINIELQEFLDKRIIRSCPDQIKIMALYVRDEYEKVHEISMMINDATGYSMLTFGLVQVAFLVSSTFWFALGLIRDMKIMSHTRKYSFISG